MNTILFNEINKLVPRARVYNSANQSINTGVYTLLTFDSIDVDNREHYDSNNTDRLYIRESGEYLIYGTFAFTGNATGYRTAGLFKNGTELARDNRASADASAFTAFIISTVISCAKGDYIQMKAFQNSGVSLSVVAETHSPILGITKLS